MIPSFVDTHSDEIFALPIVEDGSPLIQVPARPFWQIRPAYYAQNIAGAINRCYLRAEVMVRLEQVARHITAQTGWRLIILDGWRPTEVQEALYQDIYQQIVHQYPDETDNQHRQRTSEFVSLPSQDPYRPSPHLTGGSVDVTLCDERGIELDMGSDFDEPSTKSYSDAYESQAGAIRERRRILLWQMKRAGFTNLPTEWWHFDYGNQNWAYYSGVKQAIYGMIFPKI